MLAKEVMDIVGLIVLQVSFPRQQPERVWFDDRAPHPGFGANRAVAFESARAQINVRFKTNRATVTASSVSLFHRLDNTTNEESQAGQPTTLRS
jgi:hypothetical protein